MPFETSSVYINEPKTDNKTEGIYDDDVRESNMDLPYIKKVETSDIQDIIHDM